MTAVDWFMGLPEPLAWLALLAIMALEMGMVLHFLPTEVILALGTLRLAHDVPSLLLVVALATVFSTLGCFLPYSVARYGGRPLVLRFAKPLHLTPARLERFEHVMRGRGGRWLTFACRALPGLRTAPSIPAGLARMDARTFGVLSFFGCLLFNAAFGTLTLLYGKVVVDRVEAALHQAMGLVFDHPWATLLASAILLGGLVFAWRWARRAAYNKAVLEGAGSTTEDQGEPPRPLPDEPKSP
jgi:membrane protein DedA with SNARE-associated domain